MKACIVYDPQTGDILCAFAGSKKNKANFAGNWAAWPSSKQLWIDYEGSLANIDQTHQVVDGKLSERAEPLPAPKPEPRAEDLLVDVVKTLDAEGVLAKTKLPQRVQDKVDALTAKGGAP